MPSGPAMFASVDHTHYELPLATSPICISTPSASPKPVVRSPILRLRRQPLVGSAPLGAALVPASHTKYVPGLAPTADRFMQWLWPHPT
jgi:hypothetical protein